MLRGALYIATGGDRYIAAAQTSAASLKRHMPDLPITLATDRPSATRPFGSAQLEVSEADGYRAKIIAAARTPYEQTLLLDVDTYILGDLTDIFGLLGRFDMALAHAPVRVATVLPDIPGSFPEFNTGVIAYRRTAVVTRMLADWLREYDAMLSLDRPSQDQPSFRRAIYQAVDLHVATLTPEYNQRFWMGGYLNDPVRILHGWSDENGYRKVAAAMGTRMFWGVFSGARVFDQHGRRVASFDNRSALRRLAARLKYLLMR